MKCGRHRKTKVKIHELLDYIEQLPSSNPTKKHLTPDKMVRLKKYISELEYLDKVIKNLKADIKLNGEIEIYENGNQHTRRTNPALTTYLDTVKTYNQLLRQVSLLLRNTELDIKNEW